MSQKSRTDLKGVFKKNVVPSEAQFADLIDSCLNLQDGANENLLVKTLKITNTGPEITEVSTAADLGVTPSDNILPTQKAVKSYAANKDSSEIFKAGHIYSKPNGISSDGKVTIVNRNTSGTKSSLLLQDSEDSVSNPGGELTYNSASYTLTENGGASALNLKNNVVDKDVRLVTTGNGKVKICPENLENYVYNKDYFLIKLPTVASPVHPLNIDLSTYPGTSPKKVLGINFAIGPNANWYIGPKVQAAFDEETGAVSESYLCIGNDKTSEFIKFTQVHNITASQSTTLSGSLTVTGAVSADNFIDTTPSDIRIKNNIEEISKDASVEIIKNLQVHGYDFIDGFTQLSEHYQGRKVGLIAQELEKIYPKSVTTKKEFKLNDGTIINDFKRIDITELHYHHFNVTQHLLEQIKVLKAEIEELKASK